ncbi:hypothetical protein VSH64_10885 [Amycolatopsis rhabdoformis]|uniref:Lipoprotein n=1 Tax=Amycolatopsis rhabdoformis TaxID=1448059 RepID=A0ABZ1IDR4_9PSEU|nr:hypothetical protein [Amycolatopsis rhabdoformis]WSE32611.1 hypothetical protein VSH64_10885 [Amycolatopsis rhabdoformis]
MVDRRRCALLGAVFLLAAAVSACGGEPEPPAPTVGTVEVEHRLDEYLGRVASLLRPDAQVSEPVHARAAGCPGGADWAVVPRAQVTATAGELTEKLFDDLQTWLSSSGFEGVYDGDNWHPGKPADFKELDGRQRDGIRVSVRLERDAPRFTVAVTGPCAWPADREGGPPAGRLAPLGAPPALTSSIGTATYVDPESCLSPKLFTYNTAAPAYAGAGPHPMVLSVYEGIRRFDSPTFLYDQLSLSSGWQPDDVHQAQLVACVHVAKSGAGHKISCSYTTELGYGGGGSPYDFQLFDGTYHVTVRTARTGEVVGDFTLPGTLDDEKSCPYRIENYVPVLARGLDDTALERALRPWYEGRR